MRIYEPAEDGAETVRCLPRRKKEMHLLQAPKSHSKHLFSLSSIITLKNVYV